MAFPNTRITDFVIGTVASPSLFNSIQDSIIGITVGTLSHKSIVINGVGGETGISTVGDGVLELRASSAAETVPRLVTKDSNGNIKWIIDHAGYPGGQFRKVEEYWQHNFTVASSITSVNVNSTIWSAVTTSTA